MYIRNFKRLNERIQATRDAERAYRSRNRDNLIYGLYNPYDISVADKDYADMIFFKDNLDPTNLLSAIYKRGTTKTKFSQINNFNSYVKDAAKHNEEFRNENGRIKWDVITSYAIHLAKAEYATSSILQYCSTIIMTAIFLDKIQKTCFEESRKDMVFQHIRTLGQRCMPRKAPIITLEALTRLENSSEKPELGLMIFWIMSGLRFASIIELTKDHVDFDKKKGTITILPPKVKAEQKYTTKLEIKCNCICNDNGKDDSSTCLIHNGDIFCPSFPVEEKLLGSALNKTKGTYHSPRRTLAMAIKLNETILGAINKRANRIFLWSFKSNQFNNYTKDFKDHLRKPLIPIKAICHRISRASQVEKDLEEIRECDHEGEEDEEIIDLVKEDIIEDDYTMTKAKRLRKQGKRY